MLIDGGYALAGAVTGFVVGLTGVGGGALMTPILLVIFGVPPSTAIATDLWFAAITKMVGACTHERGGMVDWQVVKRLWAGSLPAALAVVLWMSMGNGVTRIDWLSKAIGIVIIISACGLLLAPSLFAMARRRRISEPVSFKARQPALTAMTGAALGLCVALTSVGAGALGSVVLLFLYPLRMTPHKLVATDLAHAIPLAVVAGLGYLIAGMVDLPMLLSLLVGSVPAVILGSLLARAISARSLQVGLAVALVAAGWKTLV